MFLFHPVIQLSLGAGWYLYRKKGRRILLPLLHGTINLLLITLALLQVLSGWQVYNAFVIG